jgi:hypothetical protein
MQDETSWTEPNEDECFETSILGLLLDSPTGPWSAQELTRELKDALAVTDALASLHGVGLIHLAGELVFPTQAAIRARRLVS